MKKESIYVVSVFLSAFLLFLLQPMVARMLLPVFGGSAAVWNTCMVFFQALLLAGYAYAHGSLARLGIRRQRLLHAAILVVSLFVLPRVHEMSDASGASPVLRILGALTLIAALPFFVLSTNSSLAQRWFAAASHGRDPFWLYAASNLGSLVALLGYPLVVEPALGLRAQLRWWSIGYGVFVALTLVLIFLTGGHPERSEGPAPGIPAPWSRRLRWVTLAAIASSLLLSVTMQIATDIVSAPLFWVLPLALYLLTFIIVFSGATRNRRLLAHLSMIGIVLCFVTMMIPTVLPLWASLVILLGTLFVGALVCHGDLADDRPRPEQLTDFYLWIAVGGVIGGIVNSLLAPMLFRSVLEYPLTLAALAFVVKPGLPRSRKAVAASGVAILALGVAAFVILRHHVAVTTTGILHWQFMPVAALVAGFAYSTTPGVFGAVTSAVALFVCLGLHFVDPVIDQGRNFFGVVRVTDNGPERVLVHGVTTHGAQYKNPEAAQIPVTYYYPRGPLGSAVDAAGANAEIGIVGLGAGSLAAMTKAGQHVTYFEIDPLVDVMARRYFTYLSDTKARVDVRIGDGRQLLAREPDGTFDLLVMDAFSSDAIPLHLLTDEAMALYLRKLKPAGLLVMHISSRYADLSRVFRGWRQRTGMRVALSRFVPTRQEEAAGVLGTDAIAIGRSPAALRPLAETRQWYWLDDDGPSVHWTDDHADLLSVLNSSILKP